MSFKKSALNSEDRSLVLNYKNNHKLYRLIFLGINILEITNFSQS